MVDWSSSVVFVQMLLGVLFKSHPPSLAIKPLDRTWNCYSSNVQLLVGFDMETSRVVLEAVGWDIYSRFSALRHGLFFNEVEEIVN